MRSRLGRIAAGVALLVVAVTPIPVTAFGLYAVFAGAAQVSAASSPYTVTAARVGAECDGNGEVFDSDNGDVLGCSEFGPIFGSSTPAFPGFSADQNGAVELRAHLLAADGLSDADVDQLQALVDQYAAQVPGAARPTDDKDSIGPLRGWGSITFGTALIIVYWIGLFAYLRYRAKGERPAQRRAIVS